MAPENDLITGHHNDGIPPVPVEILHVPAFTHRAALSNISCLQMTDTGLFLNWDPNAISGVDDEDLFYKSLRDAPLYRGAFSWAFFAVLGGLLMI